MKLYHRNPRDKATALERAYFDADRGHIGLALERMVDTREEFPQDAILEYAEGILRKDFLGQGIRAWEQFRLAQEYDPKHVFSAFNAAKFAGNEAQYRAQATHARRIAPNDPDLRLFDQIDQALAAGQPYQELLANFVAMAQQAGRHGDCAAASELALAAGDWSRSEELGLRRARCSSLRELDRTDESSRRIRGEDHPPGERLALSEALAELERVLALDPGDPKMWNYKSAWLVLMRRYEESIVAADAALAIQPLGYLKPLTNKSLSLSLLGRSEEAKKLAEQLIAAAEDLGSEFDEDVAKAKDIVESAGQVEPSDDQKLALLAEHKIRAARLTVKEMQERWETRKTGFDLARGIRQRAARYRGDWHPDYITLAAELLHDFCPEWAWEAVLELGQTDSAAYSHYLHATLFVAAQAEGVMARDACAFEVLLLLGAIEPGPIRKAYREAVLAPAATDERFAPLAERMRKELERLHPDLPRLVADQPPIDASDRQRAVSITLSRFGRQMANWSPRARRRGWGAAFREAVALAMDKLRFGSRE